MNKEKGKVEGEASGGSITGVTKDIKQIEERVIEVERIVERKIKEKKNLHIVLHWNYKKFEEKNLRKN